MEDVFLVLFGFNEPDAKIGYRIFSNESAASKFLTNIQKDSAHNGVIKRVNVEDDYFIPKELS